jgi:glycosyltransferase involved in cell wall biosynthesis
MVETGHVSKSGSGPSVAHRTIRLLRPVLRWLMAVPNVVSARRSMMRLRRVPGGPALCFLTPAFPAAPPRRDDHAVGGAVKTTYLSERFPHSFPGCNLLYTVSSVHHPAAPELVRKAKARDVKVVLNQNGVYYRAWFGAGWEVHNQPLAAVHGLSDFVVYQSEFCRISAERFLGPRSGSHRVLLNPVDLSHFGAAGQRSADPLVLLALAVPRDRAGRLDSAIRTLGVLRRSGVRARLLVPGYDPADSRDADMIVLARDWAREAGVPAGDLELAPRFTRREAPAIFRRAHLLLHPVYNDPSPNVVGEALACGLPVVYSSSGGVPELVGVDAGVGIPAPLDWDQYHAPEPAALADGVQQVAASLARYSEAARCRAEEAFSLDRYLERHAEIFEELLSQ